MSTLLRQHAEQQFAEELHELKKNETNPIPENWEMSPQSVVTYLMGGILKNGFEGFTEIHRQPPPDGDCRSTLVTDRALLLYGLPGTTKSLGQRAHGGSHIRRFDADSTGYRRNGRRGHPLWLELCPSSRQGRVRVPWYRPR